ncbi:FMN-dependent NADH-azoreductase [Granulicella sp. L60]|uniref:FMN-dependent NADH-azoreductase n=1 Tax=Granulicella sp. L60 TaxID=1641866 RepID=UPI00131E3F54|nr:NAD(P)H-dependent oxidoreductase [Granulicella sp. L60]
MNLFHVVSSPRKERSASIEVANAFIDAWHGKHPSGVVETLNVWDAQLPDFNREALAAKYASLEGKQLTPEQEKAWRKIKDLANLFLRADLILFSVPMWNFGIPYKLKHLIDTVSHKDILFTFDERGLLGLLGGKTTVIIAARGAQLGGDFPERDFDHQIAYLKTWSRMVGIENVHTLAIEKTLLGPEVDKAARTTARSTAETLAHSL